MIEEKQGFVYVATGTGYPEEAQKSAETLRKAQPSAKICLVSDRQPADISIYDDFVLLQEGEAHYLPIDKTYACLAPYDLVLFLDTDTYVVSDLSEVFKVLDRFSFALLPETKRGWDYQLDEVPRPFAEFNTGVIAFCNTPEVKTFFSEWRASYNRIKADKGLRNDQVSFRKAIFESDFRVAPLPSEYHFLGNTENYIMWDARLIHARGNLPLISQQVNARMGSRVYIPDVGVFQGFKGRKFWAIAVSSFLWRCLKLFWNGVTDGAKMNPRKWW